MLFQIPSRTRSVHETSELIRHTPDSTLISTSTQSFSPRSFLGAGPVFGLLSAVRAAVECAVLITKDADEIVRDEVSTVVAFGHQTCLQVW